MNLEELHAEGYEFYKAKNFDAALKVADELQRLDPKYKLGYYLEAAVWKELDNPVKEYFAIKKILPLLDFSSSDNKKFDTEIIFHVAEICAKFGLGKELKEAYSLIFELDSSPNAENLSGAIFHANCFENFSAADFKKLYDDYKKTFADVVPYPKKFYAHKKIRVGFMSADFCNHAVIHWSRALLTRLDKNFFETYFYSSVEKPDDITERLRKTADGWREIFDVTDEQAAKMIRDDEIDILFDLSGHTKGNRLGAAAYRPASVQMSGIGYENSTGLDCFDYFLSDVYCAGDENFFTEKLIKLPHSHICYEPPTKLEPANFPPCVKNNFVTFGSFNGFYKVTDSILLAWKKILDAVPNSRLLLKSKILGNEDVKNFIVERLKNLGLDLARIELRGFMENQFVGYNEIDIALDTFPYTGVTTTAEALYMGVPVVSLYGARQGARCGLSILKNVGLDELAVDTYDEYIKRAVMLAGDWELLIIFRKNLRLMMKKSPLMDSKNYVREIQDAFVKILNEQKNLWRNSNSVR